MTKRINIFLTFYVYRADPESQAESEGWIDWLSGYISPNEDAFEPVIDVFYPIVNDISDVDVSKRNTITATSEAIVGIIAVSIYWREFIRDILPPGSNGVVVVMRSPCNLPLSSSTRIFSCTSGSVVERVWS